MSDFSLMERFSEESLGFSLTPVHYKGKVLYFPVEVGRILGYENPVNTIRQLVNNGEFRDGEETICFKGEQLAQLKTLVKSIKTTDILNLSESVDIANSENSVISNNEVLLPSNSPVYRMLTTEGVIGLTFTSRKPIGAAFRRWMRQTVVPSIMKTGKYILGQEEEKEVDAKKLVEEYENYHKLANLLGLEGNQAKLAALARIKKVYRVDLLTDMSISLESEHQTVYISPTELGKRIGVSGRKINIWLTNLGYQTNYRDLKGTLKYSLTEKAKKDGLGKMFEDTKAHTEGTVQRIKWSEEMVDILNGYIDEGRIV